MLGDAGAGTPGMSTPSWCAGGSDLQPAAQGGDRLLSDYLLFRRVRLANELVSLALVPGDPAPPEFYLGLRKVAPSRVLETATRDWVATPLAWLNIVRQLY